MSSWRANLQHRQRHEHRPLTWVLNIKQQVHPSELQLLLPSNIDLLLRIYASGPRVQNLVAPETTQAWVEKCGRNHNGDHGVDDPVGHVLGIGHLNEV